MRKMCLKATHRRLNKFYWIFLFSSLSFAFISPCLGLPLSQKQFHSTLLVYGARECIECSKCTIYVYIIWRYRVLLFQLNLEVRMKLLARWRPRRAEMKVEFVALWLKYLIDPNILMYWQQYSTPLLLLQLLLLQLPCQRKFHRKKYPTHRIGCMCVLCVHLFCNDSGDWIYMLRYERNREEEVKKTRSHISKRIDRFPCEYASCCFEHDVYNARSLSPYTKHTRILLTMLSCVWHPFVCEWEWLLLCATFSTPVYWIHTEHFFSLFISIFISHHQTWNDYQSNLSMPLKGNGIRTHAGKTREKMIYAEKNTTFTSVLFASYPYPYRTTHGVYYFGIRKLNDRIVAKKK